MISVVMKHSPGARSWAAETAVRLGGTARQWSSETCGLVVESPYPDHCGVAEDGDVVVVFRGNIQAPGDDGLGARYDATAIAASLLQRYKADGVTAITGLWGRYEIYVLDIRKDSLITVADPYGKSQLFRFSDDQEHVVASSPHVLSVAGVALSLDRSYEDFLLVYGFVPPPKSVFANVERAKASTVFEYGDGHMVERTYESPALSLHEGEITSGEDAIEALHSGLVRATDEVAPDDDDVAVLLGGFDSALVVALLAAIGKRVHTYTFRYADERYNQDFVHELSDLTGSVPHWVEIAPETVRDGLRRYGEEATAPTNWPAYVIQTRAVCEQIRSDGFNVALSGDGCDNLFFGYPLTFRRGQVTDKLARLPKPLLNVGETIASSRVVHDLAGRPAVVGAGLLRNAQLQQPARGYLTFRVLEEGALQRLRSGERPLNATPPEQLAQELAEPYRGQDSVQLSYLGKKCLSPASQKVSASAMTAGVSIVSPYLHKGMVDLASSLPTELLRPEGEESSSIGKYALAKMAESKGLLPAEIIHQPKLAAADAPIDEWYPGPLRAVIEELIDNLPFDADRRMVESMFHPTIGERAYQRVIGSETNNVVNLSHDVSLLATYGALSGIAA